MLSSVCEWFARDLPLADNMFGHFVMDSLVTLFATIVSFWDLREFDEDFDPDSALLRFRSNFLLRWHLWEDLHLHEMLSNWQQMWNQASRPHAPATEGTGKGSAHLGLGRCKLPSLSPLLVGALGSSDREAGIALLRQCHALLRQCQLLRCHLQDALGATLVAFGWSFNRLCSRFVLVYNAGPMAGIGCGLPSVTAQPWTDIRWRVGFKTCFDNLIVQQDFSLRTFRVRLEEEDPRSFGFDLFRKYGACALRLKRSERAVVETIIVVVPQLVYVVARFSVWQDPPTGCLRA